MSKWKIQHEEFNDRTDGIQRRSRTWSDETYAKMRISRDEMIGRFRKVWGDRFDYSKSELGTGIKKKIKIICRIHGGEFEQAVGHHLDGRLSCADCRADRNHETFLQKAKEVWGDRFDYSKTRYLGEKAHINIVCREHGEYVQRASTHLLGRHGCDVCKRIRKSESQLKRLKK